MLVQIVSPRFYEGASSFGLCIMTVGIWREVSLGLVLISWATGLHVLRANDAMQYFECQNTSKEHLQDLT